MKVCAFIAGDQNIINPSIVCLSSVRKFNNNIDCFIFTEKEFVDRTQSNILDRENIAVVDISDVNFENYIDNFSDMDRWPRHVFYNYVAPAYFHGKYDYAIKLDYDILCCDKYIFEDIVPEKEDVVTIAFNARLDNLIKPEQVDLIGYDKKELNRFTAVNTGFFVIDVEEYVKRNVYKIFMEKYCKYANKLVLNGETHEQFIFGLIQCLFGHMFKRLPEGYNFRPVFKNTNKIYNIHYNTVFKPWVKYDNMDVCIENNKEIFKNLIFFNSWISHANEMKFTNFDYRKELYSPLEIFKAYKKIEEAETKKNIRLEMSKFWTDILDKIAFALPPTISCQKDITKHYMQFYIEGIDNKIHYELLRKDSRLFFCIHCEDMHLSMLLKEHFTTLAKIIDENIQYNTLGHMHINKLLSDDNFEKQFYSLLYITINHVLNLKRIIEDSKKDLNFIFNTIYRENIWGNGSGPGSDPEILKDYISFLDNFIKENNITSISDIGCGDWQYMKFINLDGINYTGYDVSSDIIDANSKNFSSENIHFIHYDGDFSKIKSTELAICKEVLQHLSNENIFNFIENMKKFKYIIIGNTFKNSNTINKDISSGACRTLDLRLAPFNIEAEHILTIDRSSQNRPDIMFLLVRN